MYDAEGETTTAESPSSSKNTNVRPEISGKVNENLIYERIIMFLSGQPDRPGNEDTAIITSYFSSSMARRVAGIRCMSADSCADSCVARRALCS